MPALDLDTIRSGIVYTLTTETEYDDPEDHFATGDDDLDAKTVADIRERMQWNDWAWCTAIVTATHPDFPTCHGTATLGGCSYEDADDFKNTQGNGEGSYYPQMCDEAADDLLQCITDFAASLTKFTAEGR